VRRLVQETGVNVNASDDLGQTPLWIASFHGRQDIVSFLLSENARTEALTEKEGYSALWVACQEGYDLFGSREFWSQEVHADYGI
jgi:ankyrin repeat protein